MLTLHPAIRADWLVLRRTGWIVFARIIGAPALLLTCCAAVACGDFYGDYGWCLAAGALLALGGSYAIAHQRLLDALERWRFGWCGALPIARGATALTLLPVATAGLILSIALVAALLFCVSLLAPHREDLPYALAGVGLGLVVGTAVAAVRVLRADVAGRGRPVDGIREPLFALSWLNDLRLPHALDWQRRAALVKWRRGGGFIMVGAMLAAVPDGPSIRLVVALVLLVLSWSWLAVVMRASADACAAVVRLLGATPLTARCARLALLRYPLVAASCALVPMIVGAILGGRGAIALAWIVCAGLASAWPLLRILRAAQSGLFGMTALLRASGLRVAYGDTRVLNGVDLEIARGEFVALIGPNGAGKTTLLHAIAGITPMREGAIAIAGHDLSKAQREAKQAIGLAIDPPCLPELLTGRECLALFAGARGLPAIPPATLALGETLSLINVLDRRIASYSLGMRQKLGIMLGLIGEPPLLLLDEPFNGLDPRSALAFKTHLAMLITKGDASVLLATHSLDIAERHATRVVLLMDGRVRRAWDAAELAAMRERLERSLEKMLAEACGE